jgi:segregation and condensation protein B
VERSEQLRIMEALIVGAAEPIAAARMADIVPGLLAADVSRCVDELNASYQEQGRAFEIWEVAGGYQLRTRPVYAGYLQQLVKDRPLRLSRAALETVAVVAYKQPATRAEIEHVRGVDVGAVLRSLVERRLVRVAGHREVPGRPILYGTTRRFLEVFGLASLKDLPTLRELQDLVAPVTDADSEVAEALTEASQPKQASALEADVPEVLH